MLGWRDAADLPNKVSRTPFIGEKHAAKCMGTRPGDWPRYFGVLTPVSVPVRLAACGVRPRRTEVGWRRLMAWEFSLGFRCP